MRRVAKRMAPHVLAHRMFLAVYPLDAIERQRLKLVDGGDSSCIPDIACVAKPVGIGG